MHSTTQKIMTHLCYMDQAEEAVNFYLSIFENSRIINISHFGKDEFAPAGTMRTITFELLGQRFWAVNGGPNCKFSNGVSIYVNCDTQEEIDYYWEKLSEGGEKQPCGLLTDKYGLSWHIAPSIMEDLLNDATPEKSGRATNAFLKMQKLDIETIRQAYEGNL